MKRALVAVAGAALFAGVATVASAAPPPGTVEVLDDRGALVGGRLGGPDAVQNAELRVRSGTLQLRFVTRRWPSVMRARAYGPFAVL
jgi:hypothetical protein